MRFSRKVTRSCRPWAELGVRLHPTAHKHTIQSGSLVFYFVGKQYGYLGHGGACLQCMDLAERLELEAFAMARDKWCAKLIDAQGAVGQYSCDLRATILGGPQPCAIRLVYL